MKPKFKIGDIIADKKNLEHQYQIVDVTRNSAKSIKGNWIGGYKKFWVGSNSYIIKNLKTNKLHWNFAWYISEKYQLIQQDKKPLRWKNYEEIII